MYDIKDEIKNIVTMQDIITKYNIKHKGTMFNCPFHSDRYASAKFYDTTFYCFSCNKTGDIIQFVQNLFNISFQDAIQKINYDFNLNINFNHKLNKNQIEEINRQKDKEKFQKKIKLQKYIILSQIYRQLNKKVKTIKNKTNIINWEENVFNISNLQQKLDELEIILDNYY